MHVLLSRKQINSLNNNKGIQLSHRQLIEPNQKETYGRGLLTHHASRVEKAIQKRTGVRLLKDHFMDHIGTGILGDIKKSFKKAGKTITKGVSDVGSKVSNVAQDTYKKINKTALKQDWGSYIEAGKGELLSIAGPALSVALQSQGIPLPLADALSQSAVASAEAVDFSKSLKGQGDEALQGGVNSLVQSGSDNAHAYMYAKATTPYDSDYSGSGFGKSILSKGSPAMLEKMAKLRALRGSKSGGSFRGSGAVSVAPASFRGSGFVGSGFSMKMPSLKKLKKSAYKVGDDIY